MEKASSIVFFLNDCGWNMSMWMSRTGLTKEVVKVNELRSMAVKVYWHFSCKEGVW